MIEKELVFNYNHNYKYIYDITVNNNSEVLKEIDDLIGYKQGEWNGNKRKDLIEFTFNDIPEIFKIITNSIIVNNVIPLKLKIKLIENNNDRIILKLKANLLNKLINLISKIINLKVFVTIENINDLSTRVKLKYIIKSILPKTIIEMANEYIESKILNNFIKKIDNYLKELKDK